MFKKFIGRPREQEPRAQTLADERQALKKAMGRATETKQPQFVVVDGQKYEVTDDGAGRSVRPA